MNEFERMQKAFETIYKNKVWLNGTSGSGSLPSTTLEYRYALEKFLRKNNIRSVVDFGCGDWIFSKLIDWSGIEYTGYDIVENLIVRNNEKYAESHIRFLRSPENINEVVSADLIIIKDVLMHLPLEAIARILTILPKKFKYALITNNTTPYEATNEQIVYGSCRPVDLRFPPFNFKARHILTYTVNLPGLEEVEKMTILLGPFK